VSSRVTWVRSNVELLYIYIYMFPMCCYISPFVPPRGCHEVGFLFLCFFRAKNRARLSGLGQSWVGLCSHFGRFENGCNAVERSLISEALETGRTR
jgi:hypothetical protein